MIVLAGAAVGGYYAAADPAEANSSNDPVASSTGRDVPDGLIGVTSTEAVGPPTAIDNHVFVVGDSVMQATATYLPDELPEWSLTVDTKVGRFTDQGVDVTRRWRKKGDAIGEIAVVGLGNNYGGDEAAFAASIDEMMAALDGVDHVIWFTVAEYRDEQAEVNRQLELATRRHPNLVLVDWNTWYEADPDLTGADDLHLTPLGAAAMSRLVADAVHDVTHAANEVPEPGVEDPVMTTKGTMPPGSGAKSSSSGSTKKSSSKKSKSKSSSSGPVGSTTPTSSPAPSPTTQTSEAPPAVDPQPTSPPPTAPATTAPAAPAAPDLVGPAQSGQTTWFAVASSGPSSRPPMSRNQPTSPVVRNVGRGSRTLGRAFDPSRLEDLPHLERGLVRRGDEHDLASHHVTDRAGEVRVVGAAQEQRVHVRGDGRREQTLGQHVHLLGVGLTSFDELHEPGTGQRGGVDRRSGRRDRRLVRARVDRADRADHTDSPIACRAHERADARVDHPDDRDVVTIRQVVERGRRGGVARHDDELGAAPLDQLLADLQREPAHLVEMPRSVGVAARVTEVDELLVGQQVHDGAGDGEPSEAGVEHGHRAVVHRPRR